MKYLSMSHVCVFSMSSARVLLLLHKRNKPTAPRCFGKQEETENSFRSYRMFFQFIEEWHIENPTF